VRFLIDTNLPAALADWIAGKGHVCDHVLRIGMAQAKDVALWRRTEETGETIVSKDEDFADLVRRTATGPSVLWLRTGNGTTRDLLALLDPLWSRIEARLASGERLIEVR
jgi:predicted nuclease of predicted toxin-antitoxin system